MKAAKAVNAAIGTLSTALAAVLVDDVVTLEEAGTLAQIGVVVLGGVITTLRVWWVTNTPE
jgi:hypothetical protein